MVSTNKFLLYNLIFSSFIIFCSIQADTNAPPTLNSVEKAQNSSGEDDSSNLDISIILLILVACVCVAVIVKETVPMIVQLFLPNKTSHRNKNKIDTVIKTETVYKREKVTDHTEVNRLIEVNKQLERQLKAQENDYKNYKKIFDQLKEEIKIPIYNNKYDQIIEEKIKSKTAKLFIVLIPLKSLYTYFISNSK